LKKDKRGILNPQFLVSHISLIGEIMSIMILILFDDFFTGRLTFRGVDWLKARLFERTKEKFERKYHFAIKYFFEFLATVIFIAYFLAGYWLLSEFVVVPILTRMQSIILIVVIVSFLICSWFINNKKMRRKYMGYD
jgi:purine-cytosine permease-like protein